MSYHRFIISPGRTGTVTLAKLFAESEPRFRRVCHEPQPSMQAMSILLHTRTVDREHVVERLRETRPEQGSNYLELNGHLSYIMPCVLEAFPRSRIVFIVRNPASWIRSGKAHTQTKAGGTVARRIKPHHLDASVILPLDEYTSSLWRLNWLFTAASTLNSLFPDRVKIVRYEDLFSGDLDIFLTVAHFLGAEIDTDTALRVLAERHNASTMRSNFLHYPEWPAAARRFTGGVMHHWLDYWNYDVMSVYPHG